MKHTDRTVSTVPSAYISTVSLNLRYQSTIMGMTFFDNPIYVTRFGAWRDGVLVDDGGEGISNAARKGRVAYDDMSDRSNDGEEGTLNDIEVMIEIKAA